MAIAFLFVRMLCDCFKSRRRLEAEILVLRHQVNVLHRRTSRRLHLRWADRALFIWLYRRCPRLLDAITIVKPETAVRWHRMGFAAYWRWKSRSICTNLVFRSDRRFARFASKIMRPNSWTRTSWLVSRRLVVRAHNWKRGKPAAVFKGTASPFTG